jgi:hypothetical protein
MCRPRLGFRGRGTCTLGWASRANGIQFSRQTAALAGGGFLVDRAFGGDFVQSLHDFVQCFLRLGEIAAGEGGEICFHLILENILASAIASAAFEGLTDTLLC